MGKIFRGALFLAPATGGGEVARRSRDGEGAAPAMVGQTPSGEPHLVGTLRGPLSGRCAATSPPASRGARKVAPLPRLCLRRMAD
ncbi:hypothetical protein MPL3365_70443 [Mesorhizobium plurifarium]|uniref:Uncharacterized protein n=1 Tax=Mesorhizobium plurifarium TaxID=69974 RepID=A0A090GCL5_MESPL|nr:hypothetical protein MPL3365_70443 [Mesorhizobium plurifarium]